MSRVPARSTCGESIVDAGQPQRVGASRLTALWAAFSSAVGLLVSYITLAGARPLFQARCGLARDPCPHPRAKARLAMALTALPSDCLLACLARVPYVDLRNTIPSTCKSLRDAVTSAALRKTRAAGWTEWAVFAGRPTIRSDCYIITASGARRTVRRSPFTAKMHCAPRCRVTKMR